MTSYDMVDAMRSVITEQREDITALKAENAKLRELVRDMACEYECGYLAVPHWLADRMHELGIEVN